MSHLQATASSTRRPWADGQRISFGAASGCDLKQGLQGTLQKGFPGARVVFVPVTCRYSLWWLISSGLCPLLSQELASYPEISLS